jgi:hypothetical protein
MGGFMKSDYMVVLVWRDRVAAEGGGTVLEVKKGLNAAASETHEFSDVDKAREKVIEILDREKDKFINAASTR